MSRANRTPDTEKAETVTRSSRNSRTNTRRLAVGAEDDAGRVSSESPRRLSGGSRSASLGIRDWSTTMRTCRPPSRMTRRIDAAPTTSNSLDRGGIGFGRAGGGSSTRVMGGRCGCCTAGSDERTRLGDDPSLTSGRRHRRRIAARLLSLVTDAWRVRRLLRQIAEPGHRSSPRFSLRTGTGAQRPGPERDLKITGEGVWSRTCRSARFCHR